MIPAVIDRSDFSQATHDLYRHNRKLISEDMNII
jgi:hypothetical protein